MTHTAAGVSRDTLDHVLDAVLGAVPVGLAVVRGPDLVVELVNRAFEELSPPRPAVGRSVQDAWPELADAVVPMLRDVLASGETRHVPDMRFHLVRRPGRSPEPAHFSVTFAPFPPDPSGRPGILWSAVETTGHVRARQRAEALEREATVAADRVHRLQRITALLASAVTMKDVARTVFTESLEILDARGVGFVWMMKPGQLELVYGHGLTVEEFKELDLAARRGERLPVRDAILSRQPVWLETPEAIRERYPVLEPLRARRGEAACGVVPLVLGERCPGLVGFTFARPFPLSVEERRFVEAVAQASAHAFERARLYEAEREARREAERVRQLQEQLMAVVGHDLRTPLHAVRMGVGALARRADLPPECGALLARIASSAERVNGILNDLLDYNRARQGGSFRLERSEVDVGEVARHAVAEFEGAARSAPTLTTSGDLRTLADPARLAQVVSNLVGNAFQHGTGGVRVAVAGLEGEVRLTVHNDGPAIPEEALAHIFEPFRRGDASSRGDAPQGSVGLGLFIVREIVRAHGGAIEVQSDGARGTTFVVRLPRAAPASAPR